jgi:hypothetical protein
LRATRKIFPVPALPAAIAPSGRTARAVRCGSSLSTARQAQHSRDQRLGEVREGLHALRPDADELAVGTRRDDQGAARIAIDAPGLGRVGERAFGSDPGQRRRRLDAAAIRHEHRVGGAARQVGGIEREHARLGRGEREPRGERGRAEDERDAPAAQGASTSTWIRATPSTW